MAEVCETCKHVFKNKNSLGFHKRRYNPLPGLGVKLHSFENTQAENRDNSDDSNSSMDDLSNSNNGTDEPSLDDEDTKTEDSNKASKQIPIPNTFVYAL